MEGLLQLDMYNGKTQPRPQATPSYSMLHAETLKSWEWPGDEASIHADGAKTENMTAFVG